MKQFKMNERQRFSIRKFSIGAASVLLGSVFFVANPATEVQAAEASTAVVAQDGDVKPDNSSALSASDPSSQNPSVGQAGTKAETQGTEKKDPGILSKDGEGEAKLEKKSTEGNSKLESNKEIAEKQDQPKTDVELSRHLNTQNLESLLSEIAAVKAENYTEESVAALQAKAEEARQVLATAQNQTEIDAAFRTLVSYKNTGLKRVKKNVEPKVPKLDTTNGKATVGLKAENTEPNGINIAGHNHSLTGTTLPEGSGFREAGTEASDIDFGYAIDNKGTFSSIDKNFNLLSGNSLSKLIAITSKGGNITDITATSSTGKPVNLEIRNRAANKYVVKATTDVTGKDSVVLSLTVKTKNGDEKVELGAYRSLGKPTIKVPTGQKESTVDEYLKGKEGTRPTINVEVPVVPNLPSYAKMKVYLIHDNDRDKGVYPEDEWAENHNPRPTRLTAKVEVPYGRVDPKTNKTTVTIQSGDYLKPLAEGKYFVLSVIEINDEKINTNPGIRASSFSDAATVATNVDKTALNTALSEETATKASAAYYNGTADKKTAYDNALKAGKEVKDKANATKEEVTNAVNALNTAKQQLDGQATNKSALQALVDEAANKASNAKYYNATQTTQTAYDQAITKAQEVLNKANVTQAEINAEKGKVETAKNALDGAETNKSALQALVDEAANMALSYKYHNADKDKKDTFDKAIEKAKAVLADLYASQKVVDDARDNLKLAKESLNGIYIPPYIPQPTPRPLPTPQPQPSTPTQPDQGATETPTSPSAPAPQPSQPTAPSQPASPAPSQSSAPTQAPRVAASPSVSSTSTQAPAQQQVDKSELRALTQELDQRLKALTTVSDPKIDAAKAVLLDAQKALEDSSLTEQGLRTAVESVKAALNSLKDVQANATDSKPAQDKKDTKQGTEDSKDSAKMTETNSVPAGVIVVSLLALLGAIAFWLVRRKKESEIQQLSTELTKVLGQLDAEKADKKVLAKAQNLLQETLDFVKEENGSAETEAKLIEELKSILAKLK